MRNAQSTHPIVEADGTLSKEQIESKDIRKVISRKIVDQNSYATWLNEEVELKDGRVVTIRNIKIEGIDRN